MVDIKLYYILDELIDNIYNHTSFEKGHATQGHVYSQEHPDKEYLDVCIMADGLSIHGKFKKEDIIFKNDYHAIEKAIDKTTTEKNDEYDRSNGLWTTLKLVVEANRGNVLIVSGNGCPYVKNKNSYKYILLEQRYI
ncbi:hypothetical protein ALNOE001_20230 [Candidatus Methanobinarius endosymbioticus]|uniref:Histidine kinase/HSP90-like ATPase domain-containing protein n=1 Tax=Candidatus Methanobinarius endosymbioticus TaxID=2006182 RepID=A0A366M8Y4_9EURY|nr:hypothetical protein ALNOE001_20230 [Candidatus Methanobinarius endosymbioticus]